MIQLRRILFPTDFSESSRAALAYACGFAEQFGAELHLLNVLHEVQPISVESAEMFLTPYSNLDEVRQAAEQALRKLPDAEWTNGRNIVRATRPGKPFVEIVGYARENNIDLIVMGTHGWTGLMHVLLGSVAEKVVRAAGCPVLTVHPKDHPFAMP